MAQSITLADLEINIHTTGDTRFAVDFTYTAQGLENKEAGIPISFDFPELDQNKLDIQAYGQSLSRMLFHEERARMAFAQAIASAHSLDLPLRIRLCMNDAHLHNLRWETLCNPQTENLTATDENTLLSRQLDANDWKPVALRSRANLKALILAANPHGLENHKLAPVDAVLEIKLAKEGLGIIQSNFLEKATLEVLTTSLREEAPDILYIVCHGTLDAQNRPWLWLEDENGNIQRVGGDELAKRIQNLAVRPALVVLASCQSAGNGEGDALSALGPRLIRAGVPAVLAMQGNISMDTVHTMMPAFFTSLRTDGCVDRALAAARGSVRGNPDAWMPVLFMRLKSGQIFEGFEPMLCNVLNLPPHYQVRQDALAELKELVQGEARRVGVTGAGHVGVQGMGGIGKSVLTAALAHDPDVQRAYPDGIIWLTFGQNPDVVARQVELADFFEKESHGFRDAQHGKAALRMLLAEKNCLLILDDVWDLRHAEDLNCLGQVGCLIITTRNVEIVRSLGASQLNVGVLSEVQSLDFIASWVDQQAADMPPEAHEVVKECNGLPLALAMIGAIVQEIPESWARVLHRLQHADLGKIRQQFPEYPYPNLLKAIEVSIDAMPLEVRERYMDMAVFPDDTPVPQAVLETFWAELGLNKFDVFDLVEEFVKRSLASRDEQGRLSLHDLQHDYVTKQCPDYPALHRRLLNAYAIICRANQNDSMISLWACGPLDGYYFEHLAHHFLKAKDFDGVYQLLTDFDYMEARLQASSVYALEADYRLALQNRHCNNRAVMEDFGECLRLESHSINRAPELLFPNMYNYLTWLAVPGELIHTLCEKGRQKRKNCLFSIQDPRPASPPWLLSIEGHTGSVNAVAYSPDGRTIISGSWDKTVKLWDRHTGRLLHSLIGHAGSVNAVVYSPDGQNIISGSWDKTTKLWSTSTGKLVRSFEGHISSVYTVSSSPDGQTIVTGSEDNTIKLWEMSTGKLIGTLEGHTSSVNSVNFSPDGQIIISGSKDGTIKLWKMSTGKLIGTLEGHTSTVNSVAFSPDGQTIISGSEDCTIKLWDSKTGRHVRSLRRHTSSVNSIAFSPDGQTIISCSGNNAISAGSNDYTIKLWDSRTGKLLQSLGGHTMSVNAVAFSPDGQTIISSSKDNSIILWNSNTGRIIQSLAGHISWVNAVAFSPDGQIIISGSRDNTVKLWNRNTGQLILSLQGHKNHVNAVAFSSDGQTIASGSRDNTIMLWDKNEGRLINLLEGHLFSVNAVAFSPDGQTIISCAGDHTIKLWNKSTGQCIRSLEGHTYPVTSVVFSPDGHTIISGSQDKTIKLWERRTGQLVYSLTGHTDYVNAVAFSPNGHIIISGSSDNTIKLWESKTGQLIRSIDGHIKGIKAVAFSPDGLIIISGSVDNTIKLWETSTGQLIRSIQGHTKSITTLAFSPDGQIIISGSQDHTIKLWKSRTATNNRSLEGHTDSVNAVAFSADSRMVISGSADKTIKLWNTTTGHLIRSLDGQTSSIASLACSTNELTVVYGSDDKTIKLCNMRTGQLIRSIQGYTESITALAFASDEQTIVSGFSDGIINLYNIDTGKITRSFKKGPFRLRMMDFFPQEHTKISDLRSNLLMPWDKDREKHVHSLEGHTGSVNAVTLSPDGQTIISGSSDSTIKLWDRITGQQIHSLEGHTDSVNSVACSPDGHTIISGSSDSTIKLWSVSTGEFIHSFVGHTDGVNAVVFSPDEQTFLSGSYDHTIKLWDLKKDTNRTLFNNTSGIRSLAISGVNLACGDEEGHVWIFEWIK